MSRFGAILVKLLSQGHCLIFIDMTDVGLLKDLIIILGVHCVSCKCNTQIPAAEKYLYSFYIILRHYF